MNTPGLSDAMSLADEVGWLGAFAAHVAVLAEHSEDLSVHQLRLHLRELAATVEDRPTVTRWVPQARAVWNASHGEGQL